MNVAADPQTSQKSVAKLLQGVEQSREGFAICDASGCFTYMNAEHLRMFGYDSPSEVLGRPWTILYREAEQAEIAAKVFPQIAFKGCWNGHLMARRRDGTLFYEDLTLSMLPDGGIVCNCRDRTALVELNRQLSRSERLFREFSDNLPQGVIIRGTDGVCAYINRLGAQLHGGVLREAVGRRLEDVLPEELMTVFCGHDAEATAKRTPVRFECDCRVAESVVALEFSVFPLIDSAGEVYSVGTIWSDVTIRRRHQQEIAATVERQRELLRMRSEFISLVSHEFRTPLSAIQTSHFLVRKFLGEADRTKLERYLTLQSEAIDNLRELVSQVLQLNRVEAAVGGPHGKLAQPAEILGKVIDQFNENAGAPRVQTRCGLPAGFIMVLDSALFRSAAENLLTNALKYSPPDSPVIVEVDCRGQELVLSVVDHGRGIPAAEQPKLFETFFRGSNVGAVPGTGLGLAIVRRAVEYHGGRVTFESTENQGSAFHLHFPLVAPAQPGADTIPVDQS
jgi:PAS domain S-box-containing protein